MKTNNSNFPIKGTDRFKYSITYQETTPESLEAGDYTDSGYTVEESVSEMADIIRESHIDYGIYYPVSANYWESTEPEQNSDYFEKGISRFYTLHLTHEDGTPLTQEESDFITALMNDGKYSFDENDYEWYKHGGDAYGVGGIIIAGLLGGFLGYSLGSYKGQMKGYAHAQAMMKEGGESTLKYKIFEGHEPKDGTPLYQVIGVDNEYVGEWHTKKADVEKELKSLSSSSTPKKLYITNHLGNSFNYLSANKAYIHWFTPKKGELTTYEFLAYPNKIDASTTSESYELEFDVAKMEALGFRVVDMGDIISDMKGTYQIIVPEQFIEFEKSPKSSLLLHIDEYITGATVFLNNYSVRQDIWGNNVARKDFGAREFSKSGKAYKGKAFGLTPKAVFITYKNPIKKGDKFTDKIKVEKDGIAFGNGGNVKDVRTFIENASDLRKELSGGQGMTKGELMILAYPDDSRSKIGSATSIGALNRKGINNKEFWHYVMDYTNNSTGKITELFKVIENRNPTVQVYDTKYESLGSMPINEAVTKFSGKQVIFDFKDDTYKGGTKPSEKKKKAKGSTSVKELETLSNGKKLNNSLAIGIIEGFEPYTEEADRVKAWAYIERHNMTEGLLGWFGRTSETMIELGYYDSSGDINWDVVESRLLKANEQDEIECKGIEASKGYRSKVDSSFGGGGRVATNEDVIKKFLTTDEEVNTKNLSTHFSEANDSEILLRNYGTLIAVRKGTDVKVSSVKYSSTTSTIQNMVARLAAEQGLKVEKVEKFEEGGETEDWQSTALKDLRESENDDTLELTGTEAQYIEVEGDGGDYMIFENEDEAEQHAIQRVREDLEETPEYFTQDWLMGHVDTEKAEGFFTEVYNEWNTSYATDIMMESSDEYDNRLVEEMVERGLMTDEEAKEEDAIETAENRIDEFVEAMTTDQIEEGDGGYEHYQMNIGKEQADKLLIEQNLIDIDSASADAVTTDGVGHFLSGYDGNTIYLQNDSVAFRTN